MTRVLDCSVCGFWFDPAVEPACGGCPLRAGCPLVCCPACGYVTVDTESSHLARLVAPLVHGRSATRRDAEDREATLAAVEPGRSVVVRGFRPGIPAIRKEQLQAYGLSPGRLVRVVQHTPVTVVHVEQTELALEDELAADVLV